MIHVRMVGWHAPAVNKFHWQPVRALAYSPRATVEKQHRDCREPAARFHHVGWQQRRHQMARRPLAARLDRRYPLRSGRTAPAGRVAVYLMARRVSPVDRIPTPAIMAA